MLFCGAVHGPKGALFSGLGGGGAAALAGSGQAVAPGVGVAERATVQLLAIAQGPAGAALSLAGGGGALAPGFAILRAGQAAAFDVGVAEGPAVALQAMAIGPAATGGAVGAGGGAGSPGGAVCSSGHASAPGVDVAEWPAGGRIGVAQGPVGAGTAGGGGGRTASFVGISGHGIVASLASAPVRPLAALPGGLYAPLKHASAPHYTTSRYVHLLCGTAIPGRSSTAPSIKCQANARKTPPAIRPPFRPGSSSPQKHPAQRRRSQVISR